MDAQGLPLVALSFHPDGSISNGTDIALLRDEHFGDPIQDSALACQAPSIEPLEPEMVDPSGSVSRPYNSARPAGISTRLDGSVFIASSRIEGNQKTIEIRLLYQCGGSGDWQMEAVDRVHRLPYDSTLLTPQGDLVMAYGWGVRAGYDQYTTQPLESVILARRSGTPCN